MIVGTKIDESKIIEIQITLNRIIEKIGDNSDHFKSKSGMYFTHMDFVIDLQKSIIKYKDNGHVAIMREGNAYKILKLLIQNRGQVVSHEEIENLFGKKHGADSSDLFRSVKKKCLDSGMLDEDFKNYFISNKGYGLIAD